MSAVLVRVITYQTDDMPAPETGTGVRWLQGWLVAFPDGTYEVVHDRSVLGVEPVQPAPQHRFWRRCARRKVKPFHRHDWRAAHDGDGWCCAGCGEWKDDER